MRTVIRKYGYWLLCTAALAAAALLGILVARGEPSGPIPEASPFAQVRFVVPGNTGTEEVSVYTEQGQGYVFLPSYADLTRLRVVTGDGSGVTLNGTSLASGASCGTICPDVEYVLGVHDLQISVVFLQSANVATMHIDTVSGNLDYIHGDKTARESAAVVLYTSDGILDFSDSRSEIRTRGNTTWAYEKKPYGLTLSTSSSLLGMDEAVSWVLLANATDETNLHNKLVYDFARQLDPKLSPESAWVDLYTNGEYRGLYLLTKKADPGPNGLDLDMASGEFLCSVDFGFRWDTLQNPFFTHGRRTVEISAPETLTVAQMEQIKQHTDRMEEAILSGSLEGLDLDSWARKYLIDEIFGNIDADLTSSQFYYANGRFYAGPIWDYDMTFGTSRRNRDPQTFVAKNAHKSGEHDSPWYSALYAAPRFYDHMVTLYAQEFLPCLEELLQGGIASASQTLSAASRMNSVRWSTLFHEMHTQGGVTASGADDLADYLQTRVRFLSSVWLDGSDYCTVQFETRPGDFYINHSVPKGTVLDAAPVNTENTVWYVAQTGDVFDINQPITEDMVLTATHPASQDTQPKTPTQYYLAALSIFVIAGAFLGLIAADAAFQKNRKERCG